MTQGDPVLLLGCGILKKEVAHLIAKNGWPLETSLLNSALHIDFDKLEKGLTGSLRKHADRETIVFYGACHPLMDRFLAEAHTIRTAGQNCVEMLLGREVFSRELAAGAFFLLEDWARRWDEIERKTFGTDKWGIIREMFHESQRTYLLAIRTPCSADFSQAAEEASQKLELPLRWMDADLDHLEQVLREALERKRAGRP